MAGCAVRFSILMGLHTNVPQSHPQERELQEHRKRIWWSVYILDRTWSFDLGQPVSIRDEDIDVDLPSIHGVPETALCDFADTEYWTASLRVANIGAQISASIYSRRSQRGSFSCRVQQALRDLNSWTETLPNDLRLTVDSSTSNSVPIITLHLYFNQVRSNQRGENRTFQSELIF
jgi:proline utilization trans-activator